MRWQGNREGAGAFTWILWTVQVLRIELAWLLLIMVTVGYPVLKDWNLRLQVLVPAIHWQVAKHSSHGRTVPFGSGWQAHRGCHS